MGKQMKAASFSLAQAKYAAGDNMPSLVISNQNEATYQVKVKLENVVGVKLPLFEPAADQSGQGGILEF